MMPSVWVVTVGAVQLVAFCLAPVEGTSGALGRSEANPSSREWAMAIGSLPAHHVDGVVVAARAEASSLCAVVAQHL